MQFVRNAALSPDGRLLATAEYSTGSGPSVLRIWNLTDNPVVRLVLPLGNVGQDLRVEFSDDGKRVAAYYTFNGGNSLIGLWSVQDGALMLNQEETQRSLLDGERRRLVSLSREKNGSKRTLSIRNLAEDPSRVQTFLVDETLVPLSITPKGDTLLCVRGEKEDSLQLVELDGLHERWSISHHRTDVTVSPDGRYFARREPGVSRYEIRAVAGAESVSHIVAKAGNTEFDNFGTDRIQSGW